MADTFTFLSSVTVSSAVSSISFSSIPQTYTDLYILLSPHTDRVSYINADLSIAINGNTASAKRAFWASAAGVVGNNGGIEGLVQGGNAGVTNQSFVFGPTTIYIPNYTNSSAKALITNWTAEGLTTDLDNARNGMSGVSYSGTAAITSITLSPNSGTNWTQHSTFYLYGIKNS